MKIGKRVKTPQGNGTVVAFEDISVGRWGIELDVTPFWYPVAYYFRHEIELINEEPHNNLPQPRL